MNKFIVTWQKADGWSGCMFRGVSKEKAEQVYNDRRDKLQKGERLWLEEETPSHDVTVLASAAK